MLIIQILRIYETNKLFSEQDAYNNIFVGYLLEQIL